MTINTISATADDFLAQELGLHDHDRLTAAKVYITQQLSPPASVWKTVNVGQTYFCLLSSSYGAEPKLCAWRRSLGDDGVLRPLYNGSQSTVWRATLFPDRDVAANGRTSIEVVLKIAPENAFGLSDAIKKEFDLAHKIYRYLNGKGVQQPPIALFGETQVLDPTSLCVLNTDNRYAYLSRLHEGDLATYLENHKQNGTLVVNDILRRFFDVVEAIKRLHDVGIAHMDIKLENMCVQNGLFCLTDFAGARFTWSRDAEPGGRAIEGTMIDPNVVLGIFTRDYTAPRDLMLELMKIKIANVVLNNPHAYTLSPKNPQDELLLFKYICEQISERQQILNIMITDDEFNNYANEIYNFLTSLTTEITEKSQTMHMLQARAGMLARRHDVHALGLSLKMLADFIELEEPLKEAVDLLCEKMTHDLYDQRPDMTAVLDQYNMLLTCITTGDFAPYFSWKAS